MNPFLLKGYRGPDYFCDRETETETICMSLRNGVDVTLYAFRRLGKSALIRHVFHQLEDEFYCIFTDLWGTKSMQDFTAELGNAVLRSQAFSERGFANRLKEFIQAIGLSVSVGPDGMPSVDMSLLSPDRSFRSLEETLRFISSLDKPVVLAFDEFQEVRKYRDGASMEAKLRTLSQQFTNIRFIYAGSEKHLMSDIFNDYASPFFQSTRMLSLKPVQADLYAAFIQKHFEKGGIRIHPEVIRHILDMTHQHTYYVQAICNALYSQKQDVGSVAEFGRFFIPFLEEKRVFYEELPARLSPNQFKVLVAIARIGVVDQPFSHHFLKVSGIIGSSSMKRTFNTLLAQQLIIEDTDGYRLYDVFLEQYLRMGR